MKVSAIKCQLCGDTIYSRARHDMHSCTCGAVSIDGGFDYMRVAWQGDKHPMPEGFELELPDGVTKKDLYDDWNLKGTKYGLIKADGSEPEGDMPGQWG